MSTGRCCFTLFYIVLLFTIFQPAGRPILLWIGFRKFFPFPYYFLRNLKLSLSGNINLKRNLVLASPRSLLARRRVTFGTSTGHFWHVDGPLLFYYLQSIYYFPARRPSNTTLNRISQFFPFSLLLPKEFETFSLFQYQCKVESCFGIAQVTFGTSTGHFWHVDGWLLACGRVVLACRRFTFGMSLVVLACPRDGSPKPVPVGPPVALSGYVRHSSPVSVQIPVSFHGFKRKSAGHLRSLPLNMWFFTP